MVSPLHTETHYTALQYRNPDDGFMLHDLVHAMGAATNMNQITPQGEQNSQDMLRPWLSYHFTLTSMQDMSILKISKAPTFLSQTKDGSCLSLRMQT
jgi:hypothetical protein